MYCVYTYVQDGARGYGTDSLGNSSSLLSHIYILTRSNKQHRRVLLRAILRHFEDYEVHGCHMYVEMS